MKNEQSRDTGNTGVKTQSEIKLIRKKQHRKLKKQGGTHWPMKMMIRYQPSNGRFRISFFPVWPCK
jgi:hypothetical protein